MCGIAGFNSTNRPVVEKMIRVLKHRGPDDQGAYTDQDVSLGHTRLSVIDTSSRGHQPMEFENLVIVYNGEIYNFRELREELESLGSRFTSATDTEVVLHSYRRWGPDCVSRFNGMWAFCIYDKQARELFLSRDRFGIKPLYYYFDGDRFIFASELKAIRQHPLELHVNESAVNYFFYQHYIGDDLAIFRNCHKLRPSQNLVFNLDRKTLTRTSYFNIEDEVSRCRSTPLSERLEAVEPTIADAVRKRLIADVPVGSFLSGGVDSSLISAIISRDRENFRTFSIGFQDQSYDEVPFSRIVADHIGTDHHVEYLDVDEDLIQHVLGNTDEPFGDSSVFPTYLLSKITRQKVTVSLSGDAGDEVFGGYDTYKAHKIARHVPGPLVRLTEGLVNLMPPSDKKVTLRFKARRFARDFGAGANRRHLDWMSTFNDALRRPLLGDAFMPAESFTTCSPDKSLLSIQLNDIHQYLAEDILKKVDLASMLNSLEARVPFLDHRLVPLVLSLPERYKVRRLTTKWLLKSIASRYLPGRIVRRPKRGFTVPISRWIRQSEMIRDVLTQASYYNHGLLDRPFVHGLLDAHLDRKADNARQLWMVFVFNHWWHRNG